MSVTRHILVVLLLLISTTFVQTKIVDIPYTDERVILTPKTGWGYWTYRGSQTTDCPGIWTSLPNEKRTISLNFTGVGISVYGYADPQVGPWIFQIDDEPPEVLSIEANITCKMIKDHQGLRNGKHLVTVTPLANTFVLTKFSVTEDVNAPKLSGSPRVIPYFLLFLFPLLVIFF